MKSATVAAARHRSWRRIGIGSSRLSPSSQTPRWRSFATNELQGMQLAVADPDNGGFYVGTVQSNTSTTIVVDDPAGAGNIIWSAIEEGDLSFVIYDFVDTAVATSASYHTAGEWTEVDYNGDEMDPEETTSLIDEGAAFASYMVGWRLYEEGF